MKMKDMGIIDKNSEKKVMNFFSSLADETRLKILLCLINGKRSVGRIHECVGRNRMTLSAISHQLKMLKDIGMVDSERDGKEKYFQLSGDFCWCILRDSFKHFSSEKSIECEKCSKLKNKSTKSKKSKK